MENKGSSRITIGLLLMLTVASLVINARCLYVYPVPNSWIYWSGDETQAMSESMAQVQTGIYSYPLAIGSIFSEGSGILKGSVWISSLMYGVPALIAHANPVDVGRTVSFILGILLLMAVYSIARRNGVQVVMALGAVLLLASSPCYLIMSHSARYDIFVGLGCIVILSILIGNEKQSRMPSGMVVGALAVACLLVSAHIWIDCFLAGVFLLWCRGFFAHWRKLVLSVCIFVSGLAILSLFYYVKTGKLDFVGPFDHVPIPLYRFFSPAAQRGNLWYRWFIVQQWSPAYIWFGIILILGTGYCLWKRVPMGKKIGIWAGAVALLIFSIVYFEVIVARYYIYILPSITVLFALAAEKIWKSIAYRSVRFIAGMVCVSILSLEIVSFAKNTFYEELYSEQIVTSNVEGLNAVKQILEKDTSPTIRAIVYTPALYGIAPHSKIQTIVPLFLYAPTQSWVRNTTPIWTRFDYLVTYNSPRILDSAQSDRLVVQLFTSYIEKVFESTGCYTDIGRSYSEDGLKGLDTLRLYKVIH
jgi:hypothetical protein